MARRRGSPDREYALERYRSLAKGYDAATRRIERKRRWAIELLRLRPDDTVLDAACGTGSALAEEARIPGPLDAVLFSYAHDVLQSPAALRNVLASARPGARVASVGAKLYPRPLSFLNFWVRWRVHDADYAG